LNIEPISKEPRLGPSNDVGGTLLKIFTGAFIFFIDRFTKVFTSTYGVLYPISVKTLFKSF